MTSESAPQYAPHHAMIKRNTLQHVHVCEPGIDTGPIIRKEQFFN